MKTFVILICGFLLCLPVAAASSSLSSDQTRYINSLSKEELFNLYAEQHADGMEQMNPNLVHSVGKKKLKKCFAEKTQEVFSHSELKEMYIQPSGMNKQKYDKKLARLYGELFPQCGKTR